MRAIMSGAIINLFCFVNDQTSISEKAVPMELKVVKYQRKLVIGGLKQEKEIMGIDCQNLVQKLQNL